MPVRSSLAPWTLVGCLIVGSIAKAQDASRPLLPPDAGTDVGNWGSVPYASPEAVALRLEERTSLRQLEDRQVKEFRDFEDRYAAEFRLLRVRHAEEREALKRTFRR
jgi:hypothetical protein